MKKIHAFEFGFGEVMRSVPCLKGVDGGRVMIRHLAERGKVVEVDDLKV